VYSKGRHVSAVDWLPGRKGVVAVACAEPASFAERVEAAGRVHTSAVLVWNFTDPIHPQVTFLFVKDCLRQQFSSGTSPTPSTRK
jgi:hypothetical protein